MKTIFSVGKTPDALKNGYVFLTKWAVRTKQRIGTVSGFTLVELIVVIAILAILWTAAFMSVSGLQGSARDASRSSDIANISQGLEIVLVKSGTYPSPDGAFSVAYSWGVLWQQGTVGYGMMNTLSAAGVNISKKPADPLNPNKEYAYSRLSSGNAYQFRADWESDSISFIPRGNRAVADFGISGIEQVSAASWNPALTYVRGNYGGIAAKTQTWNMVYVVAIPSLFVNASTGTVNLSTASATGFYIHGQTNSGGTLFTPRLVYASGALPSGDSEKTLFASGIALAYSGTSFAAQSGIAPYISALAGNNTGVLASLGGGLMMSLGGSAEVMLSGGGGNIVPPTTPAVCGTANGNTGSVAPSVSPMSNVCSVGSLSGSVTGSGPWNWTCNSTDGGSSANCIQYSNLVNGACTWLPTNAAYYGGATNYSLVNASAGTSLAASGVTTPVVNTCQFSCGGGYVLSGGSCVTRGEQQYTTPGSYTWTVPAGVTSVSVVCIGWGWAGENGWTIGGNGWGGWGLGYINGFPVVFGNTYAINVGTYAANSTFNNGTVIARGGSNGQLGGWGGTYTVDTSSGGTGGWWVGGSAGLKAGGLSSGGGGAAGYGGSIGAWGGGWNGSSTYSGGDGTFGGGGGGSWWNPKSGNGGGVGILGLGPNGTGGNINGASGWSWSNGVYWGGGAGASTSGGGPNLWANGACRIVWPGATRQFPSTDVGTP